MRKKILLTIFTMILCMPILSLKVKAADNDSNISYQKIDGVYFYLVNNSTGAVDTNHVTKFFLNGKIAYCIEPMVDINTRVYSSTNDWNVTGLSVENRRYIERVGYFGYEYAGHGNDRYWLAAQQLIWEKVNPNVSAKFTTGTNGSGEVIDLSPERNEIINLMNTYDMKASFHNTTIEGYIGDEFTVEDTNGVLNTFQIYYNGKHQITQNGNSVTIKLNDKAMGDEVVEFRKANYDNEVSIIYYNGVSQKLASLRISDPASTFFRLKSKGADVIVEKKGENVVFENASYHYEEVPLKDTVFPVYANENITDLNGNTVYKKYDLVGTLSTNEDGFSQLNDIYYGKYFTVEGETDPKHVIDDKKYEFEITKGDLIDGKLVKTLNFKNFMKKGTFELTKTDLVTGEVIPNTGIQIFTEEDRLIFTGVTDENGKIVITDIPVGVKLYMIEKNPATGYQITDEKIFFEITENGEIVKANMTNEKIKGTLDFTKLDISNDKPVPNTLIEIYDEKDNLIFSGRTDENGKIIIENLEYGKYYILEKEAPKGYKLNPEKMWFEIKTDGEIVKAVMKDELEIIEVPNTKKNEKYEVIIGGTIILVLGIGVVLFATKKIK